MNSPASKATRTVRAGLGTDQQYRAVVPPVYLTSTFGFDGFGKKGQYDYTRSGNPTRDALADALADLEGGAGATVTGSGMAALNLVCQLLKPGDRLIAPHDCYGGTHRLLTALSRRGHFEVQFADLTLTEKLHAVFASAPDMVLVETPSNPLLRITDLAAVSRLCKQHDALLVADNTFLSPHWQQPIALGADVVVHSTTKYLNGHSDVVGGAVIAASAELHEELAWWANCLGTTGAPFDSFLTLRGLRTLRPRLRLHEENATAIAEYLQAQALVERVYYPGLAGHEGHAVARRQQSGFGAMISFELAGDVASVKAFLNGLENFSLAESLGGVESLIAHPASMTHAAMDANARQTAGIRDNLLRLSVGIEHLDDLLQDLGSAFERVAALHARPAPLQAALG